jgi:hypothetical protein
MTEIIIKFFKLTPYVLAACTLVGIACFSQVVVAKQLNSWNLIPRQERLTELYFSDYHQLPTTVRSGVPEKLSFVVHNLEHQVTTYRYDFTIVSDTNKIQPLGAGEITLQDGASQLVHQTIVPPSYGSHAMVRVDLAYTGIAFGKTIPTHEAQSIDYWVSITTPPTRHGRL